MHGAAVYQPANCCSCSWFGALKASSACPFFVRGRPVVQDVLVFKAAKINAAC